jgi:hypothetical protein
MNWTAEEIAKRSDEELKSLRLNAIRHGKEEVVVLCDAELAARKPPKAVKRAAESGDRADQYVSELHFVCPGELGVTKRPDGLIVTGTWVVSADVAEQGLKHSSIVALHASKAEPSYIQGEIVNWEVRPRESRYTGDEINKTREGIDFTIRLTNAALPWQGDATGEKGYLWATIPNG